MAEIKVERKRGILPWIIGLILLVLVVWVVSRSMRHARTVDEDRGAAAADALRDNTPPRLRQFALGTGYDKLLETSGTPAALAA